MLSRRGILFGLVLLLGAGILIGAEAPEKPSALVYRLEVEGAIGPATTDYVTRAFERAAEQRAELVILRMDTPGGLDSAMRDIVKAILGASVPIASYVAPGGARAASAGTYILYASHIAAMAPATNVGAATPVQIGGVPDKDDLKKRLKRAAKDDKQDNGQEDGEAPETEPQDPMSRKTINDAVAYIRGLAEMRGRNADWAERAVRAAESLPAEEALQQKVIDVIATDVGDLLRQIDGRRVNVLGREVTLRTKGATVVPIEPDWRSQLLAVITNPNVAYILMLIGIYGLFFEFSNPGSLVPGTAGAICLLLALYAFQVLPVNYAGVALILLGIALMIGEAFMPSFGVLGIGGVVAFVIGSVILMETDVPGFGISLALIGAFALTSALFFIMVLGMAIKARRRPVVSGREELIGARAVALEDFTESGTVRVHSERWRAHTHTPLHKGAAAVVTAVDGLVLEVEPADKPQEEGS